MSSRDELIASFLKIVPVGEEQARFYLEANNWDLNSALSKYCDNRVDGDDEEEASPPSAFAATSGPPSAGQGPGSSSSRRVATLHDLSTQQESEDDEDDEESQNLFAGGEKSGIFMQNPNTKATSSLVDDILRKAAEGGQQAPEDEEEEKKPEHSYFTGTGYMLGSEQAIAGSSATGTATQDEDRRPVVRHLTFWRNGFSIEDGELMSYDDPANQEFLKAINSGRAPLQLLNVRNDQPVDMRVERRLNEDYRPPPKKAMSPFTGAGKRLGSVVPVVETSSATATNSASAAPQRAAPELSIDESQPITSLQIRLGDGTRLRARFNHTHTIRDIREFINASRAGEANRSYVLQTTLPTRELKDEEQSIFDAELLNSVVLQRYV